MSSFVKILLSTFLFFNLQQATAQPCDFVTDISEDFEIRLGDFTRNLEVFVNVPPSQIASVNWSPDNSLSCNDCYDPKTSTIEDVCYIASVTDISGCIVRDTVCVVINVSCD